VDAPAAVGAAIRRGFAPDMSISAGVLRRGEYQTSNAGTMGRFKSAILRVQREIASLPLRALGDVQRSQVLEKLSAFMVVDVNVPEGILRFAAPTAALQVRARAALSKEPDTIQWIERFDSGDTFWDIGANVGVFSLYAARQRGVSVLAFEPSAGNYMVLCRNVQENALSERITAYCIALAGGTELGVLNLSSQEMGAAIHQFGRFGEISRYYDGAAASYTQGVLGYTIDDFIQQFRPPFPTHLKIDVDGLEWPILKGAGQTLRDERLRSIMAELSVSDRAELERSVKSLSEAGFELVSRGEIQESGGHAAANHFFARLQK
jgi:FkbM family methyltransferase